MNAHKIRVMKYDKMIDNFRGSNFIVTWGRGDKETCEHLVLAPEWWDRRLKDFATIYASGCVWTRSSIADALQYYHSSIKGTF